ncbi:winged helix-turn-helix domain-containing protein [Streptomyces sp. WMMC897]|uniref:winged helix-turn-helix domain-containing protein n=1 Tax=Streptomyces sp. WMMC897 TaxID=3014782 RepID=UPI0022B5F01B|nr:winged helix-turn-helix domain-containing protein [Streptomyces sp. WMMC897]MCZ7415680.1 winged helix-turn-helix domain-containing protein [Streptomyces sp. WMMC897]
MPQASPRGTFRVVADRLRVELGDAAPLERLPSEAQLMRKYGIGRGTVRRALEVLASEGLVEPVPGVGWRLVDDSARHRPLADRLSELITTDALRVGDRFPSEAALCERFQMSRTGIRRALAQLEGRGLLEAQHGRGRVVQALPDQNGTT